MWRLISGEEARSRGRRAEADEIVDMADVSVSVG